APVEIPAVVVEAALLAGSIALSPRARRFAEEHHFNPTGIPGSGPGGRVLEEDLRRAFFEGVPRTAVTASPPPAQPLSAPLHQTAGKPATIREKIARRMREALTTSAQYTLHSSADATGLLVARARLKPAPININDMVAYCTLRVLAQFPALNGNE